MNSVASSNFTAKLIASALAIVSILVFTGSVTDPVNVTKLFVIGGFAFAALGSIFFQDAARRLLAQKVPLFIALAFLVISHYPCNLFVYIYF